MEMNPKRKKTLKNGNETQTPEPGTEIGLKTVI